MTHQSNLQLLYNDARLIDLFQALDELHSAASDGELRVFTPLSDAELIDLLQELVYTAQETIGEIEKERKQPNLRLVK